MSNSPAVGSRAAVRHYRVRFVKPQDAYRNYKDEIDAALFGCLENGDLIHRRQLFDFEQNLAAYVGVKYAVGLNSGYHALLFSLMGLGLKPGDEVITVAHTFAASVSVIVQVGAVPVLVDVGPDHLMDPKAVERAITPRTKAIMPVHLNGRVCDMDAIGAIAKKHGLKIVEDACQALGATFNGRMAGGLGDAGCFSFYPFKALGGFGDGGALTTNDEELARFATLMRYNGEDRLTGEFAYHGHTALLDNIQAAVLDVKLKHFPSWVEHRRAIAERYRKGLEGVSEVVVPHYADPRFRDSFQNYVLRAKKRDALREHLTGAGVETLVSWARPLWSHKALNLGSPNLPETERLCAEVISLPMSAETTAEEADIVTAEIRRFYGR